MRDISKDEFIRSVLRSGLMDRSTLQQRSARLSTDVHQGTNAAKALAHLLIASGDLTRYQAERLLAGRTEAFFLGDCKILDRLGAGGMGKVYLAEQVKLARRVAVKVLPAEHARDPQYVERFQREARAVAQLKHPNIVQVHDVGEQGRVHYIVMELVSGKNLKEILREKGPFSPGESVRLIEQVAKGLGHAHAHGIVHRDIKPSNLVLENETVKILDLGLARRFDSGETITREGGGLGTPDYMSPEQCRDARHADARSDLYSLGCTWYDLLSGHPPFSDLDEVSKVLAHLQSPPQPIQLVAATVSDAVARMIDTLLAKSPDDRYQTCGELLADIDRYRRAAGADPRAAIAMIDRRKVLRKAPSQPPPESSSANAETRAVPQRASPPMLLVYLALVLGGVYLGIQAWRARVLVEPIVIEVPARPAPRPPTQDSTAAATADAPAAPSPSGIRSDQTASAPTESAPATAAAPIPEPGTTHAAAPDTASVAGVEGPPPHDFKPGPEAEGTSASPSPPPEVELPKPRAPRPNFSLI